MPFFTLHRNFILRTTKGHSVEFKKGERAWVPPACVPDAVAIGAVPEDGREGDVLGDEPTPVVTLEPDQRKAKLFDAFDKLVARQERGDFTAAGLPHLKRLETLVGFEVYNKERDEAWMAYSQAKAEAE